MKRVVESWLCESCWNVFRIYTLTCFTTFWSSYGKPSGTVVQNVSLALMKNMPSAPSDFEKIDWFSDEHGHTFDTTIKIVTCVRLALRHPYEEKNIACYRWYLERLIFTVAVDTLFIVTWSIGKEQTRWQIGILSAQWFFWPFQLWVKNVLNQTNIVNKNCEVVKLHRLKFAMLNWTFLWKLKIIFLFVYIFYLPSGLYL